MNDTHKTLLYPSSYFVKGYMRASAGIVFAVVIWIVMPSSSITSVLCGLFGSVFGIFALQTLLRQKSEIRMGNSQISVAGPRNVCIRWNELNDLRLSYYSTRKDSAKGWMQLKLSSDKSSIRIDSDLDGFEDVVGKALFHARNRGLDLDLQTRHNADTLLGTDIRSGQTS